MRNRLLRRRTAAESGSKAWSGRTKPAAWPALRHSFKLGLLVGSQNGVDGRVRFRIYRQELAFQRADRSRYLVNRGRAVRRHRRAQRLMSVFKTGQYALAPRERIGENRGRLRFLRVRQSQQRGQPIHAHLNHRAGIGRRSAPTRCSRPRALCENQRRRKRRGDK